MICKKCGREFEGTFCPNCGERAEDEQNICPVCGAPHEAGDTFCPKCGYSFRSGAAAKSAPAQPAERSAVKAYRILGIANGWLFALYAALTLIFLATPVSAAALSGGSRNFGSVYARGGIGSDLRGACGAAIVFAAIGAAVAAVIAAYQLSASGKKGFSTLYTPFTLFACVFYIAQLIISCVMIGIVGGIGGGSDLVKAGVYPVLMLVFSILWLVAAIGVLVLRAALGKRESSVAEAAEEAARAAELRKKEREAEMARLRAENAVPQTSAPRGYTEVNRLARFDRTMLFIFLGIVLPMWIALWCVVANMETMTAGNWVTGATANGQASMAFWVGSAMGWILAAAIFFVFFFGRPKHKIGASFCRGKGNAFLWAVLPLLEIGCLVLMWAIVSVATETAVVSNGVRNSIMTSFIMVSIVLLIVEMFVVWIARPKLRKSVKLAVYGTLRPAKGAEPLVSFADYQRESRAYSAYIAYDKNVTFASRMTKRGGLMAGAVVLAAVFGVSILVPGLAPASLPSFADGVRQIELGDSKEEVIALLGEPNGENASLTSDLYEYYDEVYLELKEMIEGGGVSEDFDDSDIEDWEDFEDAFEDAMNGLESYADDSDKLKYFAHMYTQIRFDSEGKVTNIVCDAAYQDGLPQASKKGTAELTKTDYRRYAFNEVYYKAEYDDGSYVFARADSDFLPLQDRETFTWEDAYGNTFTAEVTASGGISGSDFAAEYGSDSHVLRFFREALETLLSPRNESGAYNIGNVTSAVFSVADEGVISSEYPLTVAFTFRKGSFSGVRAYEIWFNDPVILDSFTHNLSRDFGEIMRGMGVRALDIVEGSASYNITHLWEEPLEQELQRAAGVVPYEALVKELSAAEDGRARYEYLAVTSSGVTIFTISETAAGSGQYQTESSATSVSLQNPISVVRSG